MKKTMIALCMLFVAVFHMLAQEADTDKKKKAMDLMSVIDMKIDTTLFNEVSQNMYVSDNPKAMAMGIVVPESYDTAKEELSKKLPPEFKVTSQGEKTMNGVTIYYVEGLDTSKGNNLNTKLICMKHNADFSIMFIGVTEVGIDQKYVDAVEAAANSVIKKK